jgi:hypothetical protein
VRTATLHIAFEKCDDRPMPTEGDDAHDEDLYAALDRLELLLLRLNEAAEQIATKLDRTNNLLADLNRSQWS